jgi:hypothetical protein
MSSGKINKNQIIILFKIMQIWFPNNNFKRKLQSQKNKSLATPHRDLSVKAELKESSPKISLLVRMMLSPPRK